MDLCDFTNEPEMELDTTDLVMNKTTMFCGLPVRFGVLGEAPNTQIWFVANDVTKCLGLTKQRTQISRLQQRFPEGVTRCNVLDSNGKTRETNCVSEEVLYVIMMRSNKAEAVKFQKWVGKVIRAIRNRCNKELTLTIEMQQLALEKAKAKEDKANATHGNWLAANRQRAVLKELGVNKKGIPQFNGFDPDMPHDAFVDMIQAQRDTIHEIKMKKKRSQMTLQQFPGFVPDLTHPNHAKYNNKFPWSEPKWTNIKPTGWFCGKQPENKINNSPLANIDNAFVEPMQF